MPRADLFVGIVPPPAPTTLDDDGVEFVDMETCDDGPVVVTDE